MPPVLCWQIAALLIGGIYYVWRDLLRQQLASKNLRDRVTYMLWVAANR